VPDQDEGAEQEAAGDAAHEALLGAPVLQTGQEAARDREDREEQVEHLRDPQDDARYQAEEGGHADPRDQLRARGPMREEFGLHRTAQPIRDELPRAVAKRRAAGAETPALPPQVQGHHAAALEVPRLSQAVR